MQMTTPELRVYEAIQMVCLRLQGCDVAEVAKATGVTKPTIYRWREAGVTRPGLYTFIALASHFGVKVSIHDIRRSKLWR